MKSKPRHYTLEFKQKAVELSYAKDSVKQVSEDLDIFPSVLYRWRKELKHYGKNSFPGRGKPKMTDEEKEIVRLKKALKNAELERDILKKAIGIFSVSDKKNTGIQWEFLPVGSLFENEILHYKTVFGHYRKWCRLDVWKSCWVALLKANKPNLDLSSSDLDGSHTTALRGGQEVGYQGRKKRKTTNAIYLTDRQGLPIAMSEPVSGNHNDLFDIEVQFEEVVSTLEDAQISVDGLFINADAGFDSQRLRNKCEAKGIIANICPNKRNGNDDADHYFDEKLYQERYAIERTNAWMDSFRSLLNRFDTTLTSWKGFNFLAFIVIGIKKFYKLKKSR